MMYRIAPMRDDQARVIRRWTYDPPYQIYSLEDCEETHRELMTENFHAVTSETGDLVGFFCYGRAARVPQGFALYQDQAVDIGLALAPELCGKGLGEAFFQSGLTYGRQLYPNIPVFRLTVMDWNQRAKTLYRRQGFAPIGRFSEQRGEQNIEFIVMLRR